MSLNRVILIGRLGQDPDLRYSPSGVPVAKFSLAVERQQAPNAQGERETDWIPCVAFQKSAEFCANYLGKGRLVSVEGRMQVRKYQDQQGQNRTFTEVICDRVQGLDRRPDGEGGGPAGGGAPRQNQGGASTPPDLDAEDPFAGQ